MATCTGLVFGVRLRRGLERFDDPQPPHDKLVDLQASDSRTADGESADGERTDLQRAPGFDFAGACGIRFWTQLAGEVPVHGIANAHYRWKYYSHRVLFDLTL